MLALEKLHMEAAQMEWLNESQLSSLLLHNHFLGVPNLMRGLNDGPSIAWWKREQICENLRTARTAITQSTEDLQVNFGTHLLAKFVDKFPCLALEIFILNCVHG